MSVDYKGHSGLAEMVRTHIHIWRDLLQDAKANNFSDSEYYAHELKALRDIEDAITKLTETDK